MNASLGGPLLQQFGAVIPTPATSVGVAYGASEAVDVAAELLPTGLAFSPGNGSVPALGLGMGFAWHPIERRREVFTVGGTMYGMSNRLDAVLFSDLWVAGGYRLARWFSLHGGVHNLVRLGVSDPYVARTLPWSPTLFALFSFGPFGRTTFDVELRWYNFVENGNRTAPAFISLGGQGAVGVNLGVNTDWGPL